MCNYLFTGKPDPPAFNVKGTQLSDLVEDDPNRAGPSRSEASVTCYSSKGEPKPTFQWFIGKPKALLLSFLFHIQVDHESNSTLINSSSFSLHCPVFSKTTYNFSGSVNYYVFLVADDEPITSNLGPLNETRSGDNTFTFQDLVNYRFTYKDNGKKLRCTVVHDALTDQDKKDVVRDIVVQCKEITAEIFIIFKHKL